MSTDEWCFEKAGEERIWNKSNLLTISHNSKTRILHIIQYIPLFVAVFPANNLNNTSQHSTRHEDGYEERRVHDADCRSARSAAVSRVARCADHAVTRSLAAKEVNLYLLMLQVIKIILPRIMLMIIFEQFLHLIAIFI